MVVLDVMQDLCFVDNLLVIGEFGICFYVGVLLQVSDGVWLGMLCVIGKLLCVVFGDVDWIKLMQLVVIVMVWLEILWIFSYVDSLIFLFNCSCLIVDLYSFVVLGQGGEGLFGKLIVVVVDICDCVYLCDMIKVLGWDYVEGFLIQVKEQLCQLLGEVVFYCIGIMIFVYLEWCDIWQ